jgi:multidrug resistance efflux pump
MIRKLILPVLGLLMLGLAIRHVVQAEQQPPRPSPPLEPARSPFNHKVAGAGLVEPRSENIAVGSHLPGVVAEVFVQVGQRVKQGEPLFRLDDRQLQAELRMRQAALAAAQAQLRRLESMPRPEELPASEARVREAQAQVLDQEQLHRRAEALYRDRAVAEEELVRRKQALAVAREQLERAKADDSLLKAGAWDADKAVARAAVEQAQAQLGQTRTELGRLVVTAPIDATVLQKNVRAGEYVGAPPGQALLVLGHVEPLHVRVDIDEHDIPRFHAGAVAKAYLRGRPQVEFDLAFVRVEPYVVPKKSLTGDNTERVDTRILQVIYAMPSPPQRLYVGQQMDVFIEAAPN